MINVLFVDDEVAVLEGLEARLRSQRAQWRMSFAEGGAQALGFLGTQRFDVVVTDMRMPGIDGAALLEQARAIYPHIVRIVLTGQTDKEELLRALPVAHQILAKPCQVSDLEVAVGRASALQAVLRQPLVLSALGSVRELPSVPRIYAELVHAVEECKSSAATVAGIVEQDAAVTARLLQLVNSPFLGLASSINNVQDAVAYLGFEAVRSVVLCVGLFDRSGPVRPGTTISLDRVQAHALRVARIGRQISGDPQQGNAVFAAAILHDLGHVLMASLLPDLRATAARAAMARKIPLREAEQQELGFTHADLGAQLLSLWGLPYSLVEAVAHHHHPSRALEPTLGLVGTLHVADHLAHKETGAIVREAAMEEGFVERLGLAAQLAAWESQIASQVSAAGRDQ